MSGSLAMGSKYFDRPDDLVLARQIAEGCYLGYHHTATGLGPEAMIFQGSKETNKFVTDPDTFFNKPLSRKEYILRPGKFNKKKHTVANEESKRNQRFGAVSAPPFF
jgi:mannosyl-oligosaccharide alpha-1,2-mannosidase